MGLIVILIFSCSKLSYVALVPVASCNFKESGACETLHTFLKQHFLANVFIWGREGTGRIGPLA